MPEAPFTVFLDRDGVLNADPGFGIRRASGYALLPGAAEAFARLKRAGLRTCLVTNQPWVGMLTATPGMIRRVHAEMQRQLAAAGAGGIDHIEAAYAPPLQRLRFGPFRRRKPNPGLLEATVRWIEGRGEAFGKARAVMVGDTWRDAGAAQNFGVPCILLATTHARDELARRVEERGFRVPEIVPDFAAAVDRILAMSGADGSRARPAKGNGPSRAKPPRARQGSAAGANTRGPG